MTVRKKATRKKVVQRKPVVRKGLVKKVPFRRLAKASTTHTFDELVFMFYYEFGRGAELPATFLAIKQAYTRYQAILHSGLDDGSFDNEALVIATKECCQRAGEISTSIAKFKGHPKITVADYDQACNLLEAISGGGAGGLC